MSGPIRHLPELAKSHGAPEPMLPGLGHEIWLPERRQLIRATAALPVFISWHGYIIAVTVLDATSSGIRIDAALPLSAVGDAVQVQFAGSATLQGEVRWCKDGHVGVRLSSIESDVLNELRSEYHGSKYFTHVIAWQKRRRRERGALIQVLEGKDVPSKTTALRLFSHDP